MEGVSESPTTLLEGLADAVPSTFTRTVNPAPTPALSRQVTLLSLTRVMGTGGAVVVSHKSSMFPDCPVGRKGE